MLTADGGQWRLLDSGGSVIQLDPEAPKPRILEDGRVMQGAIEVTQIGLVTADDQQMLRKTGDTLFTADREIMKPANGKLISESIERSSFDVMSGLANMIEVTRAYELNANMIKMQDDITGQLINRVGRVA